MDQNYTPDGLRGASDEAGYGLLIEGPGTETPCPTPIRLSRAHRETGEMSAGPAVPCKRPACPSCGPILRRRHGAHFTDVFEGRTGLSFVSLTLDRVSLREFGAGDTARLYISHAFSSVLRPRLIRECRKIGGRFAYLAATERHQNGSPHMHVLMDSGLPEHVIRWHAFASGFGPSMDVRPVDPDRDSVGSAVRYLLKSAFGPDRSPGERVVKTSKGIGYDGGVARAARRELMAAKGIVNDPDYVIETAHDRVPPRRRPQGITPQDKQQFEAVRAGTRRDHYIQISDDGKRGIRHTYSKAVGGYRADAVVIERVGDGRDVIVVAEGVSPEDARRHLAGKLF